MPGTFYGLETAKRGLKTHQNLLDITGHNIANANTPGYSRQEAVLQATSPYTNPTMNSSVTPGQIGSGVEVSMIRRIRDEFLDHQVLSTASDKAYWEEQIDVLQKAETFFAEPASDGIGQGMIDFFKSWMDLNNTPQDSGIKATVAQLGDGLASLMSYTYKQLDTVQKSVAIADTPGLVGNGELAQKVGRVNDILVQIRDLTTTIKKVYSTGQQPNDLLDQRDQLFEELSELGPVKVTMESEGSKNTGGLVEFSFYGQSIDLDSLDKFNLTTDGDSITLNYGADHVINLTDHCHDINKGALLGLERARQDVIGFKEKLNAMAGALKDKVKANKNLDFFTGDLTGTFKVNSAVISNPDLIDGTTAKDMANLRDEKIDSLDSLTFENYYNQLITEVGGSAKGSDSMAANLSAISQQVQALRDSVSGVSIDEELTKMIQYQYGFQASARVISTLDEMLDVVINRLF